MRLLEGLIPAKLDQGQPIVLQRTPTRFGRVTMKFEPLYNNTGWKLDFTLEPAQRAETVELPLSINGKQFERTEGAKFHQQTSKILIDPEATTWSAFWQ